MDRLRALGVEEEFVLVDSETGAPVPAAAEVLTAAASLSPAHADFALHPELLSTQVEAATGRCTTLDQLAEQLIAGRRALATAARSLGLWLIAVGSPVLGGAAPVSRGARFTAIAGRYAGVIRDYQACGCHVHVEVPDREDAVAVLNHVRPWLPVLLALSVNSPFHLGADTGYASWRMVAQSRFPGAGAPPVFASAADYRDQVEQLVQLGVLVDDRMTFWLVRPSAHLPTVEFRVADVGMRPRDALVQAALCRALVAVALDAVAEHRPPSPVPDQTLAAAVWSVARFGLSGQCAHPVTSAPVPASTAVHALLDYVRSPLARSGDLTAVTRWVADIMRAGTGADHQRAVINDGPHAIVRMLAAATDSSQTTEPEPTRGTPR